MNDEIREGEKSFKCLRNCFTVDEESNEDAEMSMGEELKTFEALEKLLNAKSLGFSVKR